MKMLFAASVFATVLAVSTAFAIEVPATQPIKPIEGPNTRYVAFQPIKGIEGIEGPDIRQTGDRQSTQPVKGIEGPDIRLTAIALEVPSTQPVKETEGPDIRLTVVQHPSLPVEGPEGPDVR